MQATNVKILKLVQRLSGHVDSWNLEKGFGFVTDGKNRYFLHANDLPRDLGCRELAPGTEVTFELMTDKKKPDKKQAFKIEVKKMQPRIAGYVEDWNHDKGFGFVNDGENKYFLHANELQTSLGCRELAAGTEVTFELVPDEKKPDKKQACKVAIMGMHPPMGGPMGGWNQDGPPPGSYPDYPPRGNYPDHPPRGGYPDYPPRGGYPD